MNVQNETAGAAITYTIYKLPGTTPIAILRNANVLNSLVGGNYRVVATQSNNSAAATENITIERQIIPLNFTISGTNTTCGNLGSMTASVFSGTGVSYEIVSGPMLAPTQASPTFTGLLAGTYQIRVTDNCGQGSVTTHTLFNIEPELTIADATFPDAELAACNLITTANSITPAANSELTYPLRVSYTVYPPGSGAPVSYNQTIISGDATTLELRQTIPFYHDQPYNYNIVVTDNCGNSFQQNCMINQKIGVAIKKRRAQCGTYFLSIEASNYQPPFTLSFLSVPTGFSGSGSSVQNTSSVLFGDEDHPEPFGNYSIQITDNCNRTAIINSNVAFVLPVPNVVYKRNPGCSDLNTVTVKIEDYKVVAAQIVSAPASYPATALRDLASFINTEGNLVILNMVPGDYTLELTDDCGNLYTVIIQPQPLRTNAVILKSVSCNPGKASLLIKSDTELQNVMLTAAPAGYVGNLPQNISHLINSGNRALLSMNDLIPGNYSFDVTNVCNIVLQKSVTLTGYDVTQNTVTVDEHCGSFDLAIANTSNAAAPKYWLQKLVDPANGKWGHPETNVIFNGTTEPTVQNSYHLENNNTVFNIGYNGNFRVIKSFKIYENGDISSTRICTEVLKEFDFFGVLEINSFDKTNCNGQNSDINVNAVGFAPLRYEIETKNGAPFPVNNGNDPLFTNLEAGSYKFIVYDHCNNFTTRTIDIGFLPSILSTIHTPANLIGCENTDDNHKADFRLSDQNAEILGSLDAAIYNISYHLSPGDATTDVNPLPDNYTSENKTLYARVEYNNRSDCYGIVSFELMVNEMPVLQLQQSYFICPNGTATLTADPGYQHYTWSTGATDVNQITVNQPGQYSVMISETQNGKTCSLIFNIDVVLSEIATVNRIETNDFTEAQNSFTVFINQADMVNYRFSLDNVNFQESNVFSGLSPGDYNVYIRDINGCDSAVQEVSLMNYARFITPNGDGYNDHWKIINAKPDAEYSVSIFDRYGKLLKRLQAGDDEWDGSFNGQKLKPDDYWFVLTRKNGKTYRGHFSIK